MKLYYVAINNTAYKSAESALIALSDKDTSLFEDIANDEGYYDYISSLSPDEVPVSKLKYVLNKSEKIFNETLSEDDRYWIINVDED